MNKELKKKNVFTSMSKTQKFLLLLGIPVLTFPVLPIVIFLFIGLLPTLTIAVTDTKNLNKLITVGCMNLAGVFPFIISIINNYSINSAFNSLSNVLNLIIMLSSAAIGLLLYSELPGLFVFITNILRKRNINIIDIKLKKLEEEWGSDILMLENKESKNAPKSVKKSEKEPMKQAS